jgi:hypothetical protein
MNFLKPTHVAGTLHRHSGDLKLAPLKNGVGIQVF